MVLLTDIEGFGATYRNDQDRGVVRMAQFKALRDAFSESGLGDLNLRYWEDRGDGLLVVLPAAVPTGTVLEAMVPKLAVTLQQHNRRSAEPVRIKMRLAVHVGVVACDPVGVSGEAIIHTARMLEAGAFKRGLRESSAQLGMIVSSAIYEGIVRHNPESLHAHEYTMVRSRVKESRVTAWMRFTGHAVPPG